eukprot:7566386-Pyramimonas_sp.AAC.1
MSKRKTKHRQRLRKLRRHKRALPELKEQRIGKCFRAGASPALTYGVEILGLDSAGLLQLRRDYCRQVQPFHGGVSLSAKLVLDGDPALRQAVAPALQWSRMVWMAASQPDTAVVSLQVLKSWWGNALLHIDIAALEWK